MAEGPQSFGWYVVMDERQQVVFSREYRTLKKRATVETDVARYLDPGTVWGHGLTLAEALEEAMARWLDCYGWKGQQDASNHTEGE